MIFEIKPFETIYKMLFSFLVLYIKLSNEYKIPRWAIYEIVKKGNENLCSKEDYEEISQYKRLCNTNKDYMGGESRCYEVINKFKGYNCVVLEESETIDSVLSKIDSSVELLMINNGFDFEATINFNKLPSKMMVLYNTLEIYSDESIFNSAMKVMMNQPFSKKQKDHFIHKKLANSEDEGSEMKSRIKLVGNIKDKVSFLSLSLCNFKIIESDLNVDSLSLYFAFLNSTSEYKIQTNQFFSLFYTNSELFDQLSDLSYIKTNSFYIYDTSYYDEPMHYTIKFGETNWEVLDDDEESENTIIPNSIAKQFGLISISEVTTFNANSKSKFPENFVFAPVLFIPMYGPSSYLYLDDEDEDEENGKKLLDAFQFSIKKTGEWNDLDKMKLTIVADKNNVQVDTKEMNDNAEIVENEISIENPSKPDDDKLNIPLIVGIVVACVVVVVIIIVVVVVVMKKKRVQNK